MVKETLETLVAQETDLVKRIYELKQRLIESEQRESNKELDLWINTEFKKKGLTNSDQRKAYVKKGMSNDIKISALLKNQINICENVLRIIRFKERAIVEGAYHEDDNEYVFYDKFLDDILKKIEGE